MRFHRLKTWPEYFEAVAAGTKTFEVRRDDRGFEVGDVLWLEEWDPQPGAYTGDFVRRRVSYILRGPAFGVQEGFCVMALAGE